MKATTTPNQTSPKEAMMNKNYALANGLIGFRSSTLRVIVTREAGQYVWVTTADLLDSGTELVLDASQIQPIEPETVQRHKEGLVTF